LEAARIAVALLRFEELAAHLSDAHTSPGALRVGVDAYTFSPSWRQVPHSQVEAFLVALPSPVLLAPTTIRGVIALTLLHELSGERRRWAEKTYSNFATGLDELSEALGLSSSSRILLEFDDESHVFSLAGVREWSQQFAVQVGWNIGGLKGEPRADACMRLRRGDGQRFRGRSCMIPHWYTPPDPASGAA
jgi:hypothetical protein